MKLITHLTIASLICYSQPIKYKSDEMDDLIGSIITNRHSPHKEQKQKGPVDSMVDEVY